MPQAASASHTDLDISVRTGRHEPVRRVTYRYARVGFWSLTACSGWLEGGSEISEAGWEKGCGGKMECRFAGADAGSIEIDVCRALEKCALEVSVYISVIGYM